MLSQPLDNVGRHQCEWSLHIDEVASVRKRIASGNNGQRVVHVRRFDEWNADATEVKRAVAIVQWSNAVRGSCADDEQMTVVFDPGGSVTGCFAGAANFDALHVGAEREVFFRAVPQRRTHSSLDRASIAESSQCVKRCRCQVAN